MSNFFEQRRQQFLTEEYYDRFIDYENETISLTLESDAFEDDQYNCGEAERWELLKDSYKGLMYIQYTAGQPIEELVPLFEKVIESYEKKTESLAIFHKSNRPSILTNIEEILPTVGLAYLLDRRDILPCITTLINGENGGRLIEDAITSRFLHINDKNHPVLDYEGDETLYNGSHANWCKVLDAVNDDENKANAIQYLDEYLSDWYMLNKHESWYNGHLHLENKYSYVGYWAFEVAAMVYFLDLDDTLLHRHLFYPKDIVQWIRSRTATMTTNNDVTKIKVKGGEKCSKTGYWTTPAQPDTRPYFTEGEILPKLSHTDCGEVYWYFDGDE